MAKWLPVIICFSVPTTVGLHYCFEELLHTLWSGKKGQSPQGKHFIFKKKNNKKKLLDQLFCNIILLKHLRFSRNKKVQYIETRNYQMHLKYTGVIPNCISPLWFKMLNASSNTIRCENFSYNLRLWRLSHCTVGFFNSISSPYLLRRNFQFDTCLASSRQSVCLGCFQTHSRLYYTSP